ncbi:hypothetical protein [Streptomyces sp. NPDC047000]|uniref:hypothetical protein n=1 Tax=Streptomyces sp. NPDC047000 TaxID=3155474 RepID=UPI0033FA8B72
MTVLDRCGTTWSCGTATTEPLPLKLGSGTAPSDFDTGDHVNLTTDGYQAVTSALDLTTLGPDA